MGRILLVNRAVPAAGTYAVPSVEIQDIAHILCHARLDHGSGGTTVKAYVQTSVDNGTTWSDIMAFAFATADSHKDSKVLAVNTLAAATVTTDGALADDTILDGLIGSQLRVKFVVVGTYTASTLSVWAEVK